MHKIPANTLFMGQNMIFVPECHSTNDLALQYCQLNGAGEGTVIVTGNQTRGRGQRGNGWEAEPGKNLTFSIILTPTFLPVTDQFQLTRVTSLAIRDYLQDKAQIPVAIKWPNDILVNDSKICGILIENQIQGTRLEHTVIGIGLNINQVRFDVQKATSLQLVTGSNHELQAELELLLGMFEVRYLQLRQGKGQHLVSEYLQAMYWRDEKHIFLSGSDEFEGVIRGTDANGSLLIETAAGTRTVGIKEVSFVR